MHRRTLAVLFTLALASAGCASTPDELKGTFTPTEAATAADGDVGDRVRWGGRLLEVQPQKQRTCFEILAQSLDARTRPKNRSGAPGRRFLACREGFSDPAAFPADADVTVTGELSGFEQRGIGDYDYRYPVVELDTIHVWPERRSIEPRPVAPPFWWYDPYWPYYRHRY